MPDIRSSIVQPLPSKSRYRVRKSRNLLSSALDRPRVRSATVRIESAVMRKAGNSCQSSGTLACLGSTLSAPSAAATRSRSSPEKLQTSSVAQAPRTGGRRTFEATVEPRAVSVRSQVPARAWTCKRPSGSSRAGSSLSRLTGVKPSGSACERSSSRPAPDTRRRIRVVRLAGTWSRTRR